MQPIASTAEILGRKALGRDVDAAWVDWACGMLAAGFDTEHLRILAGEHAPYEQFALQHLTDKVFAELGVDLSDKERSIRSYISYLAQRVLAGELHAFRALGSLKDLFYELDYTPYLQRSYLLFHAKEQLLTEKYQYYLDEATKENIDDLITQHFQALSDGRFI